MAVSSISANDKLDKASVQRALWTPARALFASFLGVILCGAAALRLPGSCNGYISVIDALFISTSAVCVTGLTMFDVPTFFTRQGQWIIMFLIQFGGLGIITFTTWIMLLTGRNIGVLTRLTNTTAYGTLRGLNWKSILLGVFVFTFLLEGAGAGILYLRWRSVFETSEEAWFQSVFHSVSAFCNAGFSTHCGGLLNYVADPVINLTIAFLIIAGGIGFIVLSDLVRRLLRRGHPRLALHSRVTLRVTAWLLMGGMLLILITEWRNALEPLSWDAKILAAFFSECLSPNRRI